METIPERHKTLQKVYCGLKTVQQDNFEINGLTFVHIFVFTVDATGTVDPEDAPSKSDQLTSTEDLEHGLGII